MTDKVNLKTLALAGARSRRQMIFGSAIGLAGLAISRDYTYGQSASGQSERSKEITTTRAIHQEEDFKASAQRIYEALLDSKQFTAFSGDLGGAEIDPKVGGAFSLFGGHIVGRSLELIPNRRIVQAWRVVPWPEGVYSIARFELKEQGSATRVVFDHTGFPADEAEHLASGWHEHYWDALRKYLG